MRVAALYDIHGNLPALEAVLRELEGEGADRVLIGGDVIPGPMARGCMELLGDLDLPTDFISGNGEREVLAILAGGVGPSVPPSVRESIRWSGEQLSPRQRDLIASWDATVRIEVDGIGEVLFCHATPASDSDIFTRETTVDRLLPVFEPSGAPLCVCGHTHMQFDRMVGPTRVVNAGSVGMPFGEPGAYWALLGPGIELRRTMYDAKHAGERILHSGYPQAAEFAESNVLNPPPEDAMLARLESAAL